VRGVDGVVVAAEFLSWWVSPRLVEEVIQALVTFPHAGPTELPQAAPGGQR
jgi:hypothetical protein